MFSKNSLVAALGSRGQRQLPPHLPPHSIYHPLLPRGLRLRHAGDWLHLLPALPSAGLPSSPAPSSTAWEPTSTPGRGRAWPAAGTGTGSQGTRASQLPCTTQYRQRNYTFNIPAIPEINLQLKDEDKCLLIYENLGSRKERSFAILVASFGVSISADHQSMQKKLKGCFGCGVENFLVPAQPCKSLLRLH